MLRTAIKNVAGLILIATMGGREGSPRQIFLKEEDIPIRQTCVTVFYPNDSQPMARQDVLHNGQCLAADGKIIFERNRIETGGEWQTPQTVMWP